MEDLIQIDINRERQIMINAVNSGEDLTTKKINVKINDSWCQGTISEYDTTSKIANIQLKNKDNVTVTLSTSVTNHKCWIKGIDPAEKDIIITTDSHNHQVLPTQVGSFGAPPTVRRADGRISADSKD